MFFLVNILVPQELIHMLLLHIKLLRISMIVYCIQLFKLHPSLFQLFPFCFVIAALKLHLRVVIGTRLSYLPPPPLPGSWSSASNKMTILLYDSLNLFEKVLHFLGIYLL